MKPGSLLKDRFYVLDNLGAGGLSRVLRVLDLSTGETLAVKRLTARFGEADDAYLRRQQKLSLEGVVGQKLNGISGVSIIRDTFDHNGQTYVLMEVVPGVDLSRFMTVNRPLKRRTAIAIACQIGLILTAVHARGVVHKDVKPLNAIVDRKGKVHLIDFGISDKIGSENRGGGTPEYTPPEQLYDLNVAPHSDVYALGCLLCELVTTSPPWGEEDGYNHTGPELPLSPSALHRLGPDLGPIVARMLRRDPSDRFSTAEEVVRHLMALLPPPGSPLDPQAPHPDPEAWLRSRDLAG